MALKSSLLGELETHREEALSGQALAERFGVSRNAVWKAINALKAEGYSIEATPNLGYRLATGSDRLSAEGIRAALENPSLPIFCYETLDSTNSEAKRRLAGGETGPFLLAAETQTAGRGRLGRMFYSPEGTGLYMTVAFPAGRAADETLGITAYAAVCVARAIERFTGLHASIKWVNDLYLGSRKICGILTEAVTDFESGALEALLVGVGINLRSAPLPENLKKVVGTLNCEAPIKNRLAALIAESLLRYPPEENFLAEYKARSMTLGRRVLWTQGSRSGEGRAVDLDEHGALAVEAPNGERTLLHSGEITLLPE